MLSLLRKVFGCWHKWSKWSQPYIVKKFHWDHGARESMGMTTTYDTVFQNRRCEKCGLMQDKEV